MAEWYEGQDDLGDPLSDVALDRIWKAERRICGSTMRALFATVAAKERELQSLQAEVARLKHPAWPEVVKHLNALVETDEGKALIRWHMTTEEQLAAAKEVIDLLHALTDDELQWIEVLGRNPGFDGPDFAVEHHVLDVDGGELHHRFEGKTLLDCLRQARDASESEGVAARLCPDGPEEGGRR